MQKSTKWSEPYSSSSSSFTKQSCSIIISNTASDYRSTVATCLSCTRFYRAMLCRVGLVSQCTKFDVSRFTRYEAMNGGAKCRKWGGLGV